MIKISKKGLIITDDEEVTQMQKEFAEKQCIIFPDLFDDQLLQPLLAAVEKTEFHQREYLSKEKVFGSDLSTERQNMPLMQLNFLLNNSKLFQLVEQITCCRQISGFEGRIYRNMADAGHKLDWHDDLQIKGRIIALSINLGRERFSGGEFQIREKESGKILREVSCGNPGDMHMFNISPELQHRVLPTTGNVPRTACAGWFTDKQYLSKIED